MSVHEMDSAGKWWDLFPCQLRTTWRSTHTFTGAIVYHTGPGRSIIIWLEYYSALNSFSVYVLGQ